MMGGSATLLRCAAPAVILALSEDEEGPLREMQVTQQRNRLQ